MSTPTLPIGHWTSVHESLPDDFTTCLVWSTHLNEAVMAYHDSWEPSGWFAPHNDLRIHSVTHWAADISDPNQQHPTHNTQHHTSHP